MKIERQINNRCASGQGLVEFALILPVMLLLMMGIIDFGRIIFIYNQISHATREAVRAGAVNPTDCAAIENKAKSFLILMDPAAVDITIQYDDGQTIKGACPGSVPSPLPSGYRLRVHMQTAVEPITPLISNFIHSVPIGYASARTILSVSLAPTDPGGPTRTPGPTETPEPALIVNFLTGYPYRKDNNPNKGDIYGYVCVTDQGGAPVEGAGVTFARSGNTYSLVTGPSGCGCTQLGNDNKAGDLVNVSASKAGYSDGSTTGTVVNRTDGMGCTAPTASPTPTLTRTPTRTPTPTNTPIGYPNPPTNLRHAAGSPLCADPKSVSFEWDASIQPPPIVSYKLYRSIDNQLVWQGSTTYCTNCDAGFAGISATGSNYYVRAVSDMGLESASSNLVWAQCIPTPTPSLTPTPSRTPTITPTPTDTRTPTITPSPTPIICGKIAGVFSSGPNDTINWTITNQDATNKLTLVGIQNMSWPSAHSGVNSITMGGVQIFSATGQGQSSPASWGDCGGYTPCVAWKSGSPVSAREIAAGGTKTLTFDFKAGTTIVEANYLWTLKYQFQDGTVCYKAHP